MTFEEIKPLIDELSPDDIQRLNEYLKQQRHPQIKEMDIDALLEAADLIREGLSEEELDDMIAVMNGK